MPGAPSAGLPLRARQGGKGIQMVRTRGAHEKANDELHRRAYTHHLVKTGRYVIAQSGGGVDPEKAAEDANGIDDAAPVATELPEPAPRADSRPGFRERMIAARAAKKKMRDDFVPSTSQDDYDHFAKHVDNVAKVMDGSEQERTMILVKPPKGLERALDTLVRRSLEDGHVPPKSIDRAKRFAMAKPAGKRRMMKGRGFGKFMKGVGKFLWGGVKLATKIATPIIGAVAPEALPALAAARAGEAAVDALTKKQGVAAAVSSGISAGSSTMAIGQGAGAVAGKAQGVIGSLAPELGGAAEAAATVL